MPDQHHRTRLRLRLAGLRSRRELVFWVGSALVGLAAVLFAQASDLAQHLAAQLRQQLPLAPLLLLPAAFALAAAMTVRFFPGAQGSGIPQVIAARTSEGWGSRFSLLTLKVATGKILATLLVMLAGASVGREGPTVQIAAAILLTVALRARLPAQPGLPLAGGAAGVAAAFNTPLAGIVFAIEELARSYEQKASGLVLTAVIIAGLCSLALQGNYVYFGRHHLEPHLHEFLALPLAAILGGLVGGLFSRVVLWSGGAPARLFGGAFRGRPVLWAAAWGLVVAVAGLLSGGEAFGTGYAQSRAAIEGGDLPLLYMPLKLVTTIGSAASGVPGGIFAPSLSIGAGVGDLLARLLPACDRGVLVVMAIAACFAGVVQAPITAFVIVMEMVDGHALLIPLMAAAVLGARTARLICPEPLYHGLSRRFLTRPAPVPAPMEQPSP
ncbi:chloride channel protein [Oleisolibacter albus]|uniref:chloride channel protein n=1 Tax=Oleisolibacter albus TaxID=2171757 RepID=UPI000DF27D34|nr:chloride channel protein [Oleisolibacter albus]